MIEKILLAGLTTFIIATTPLTEEVDSTILTEEENTSEIENSPEETYTCSIILETGKGGSVLTSIESGNVGDLVTIYVSPYFLYMINEVFVNGELVQLQNDNTYEFALIEGENIVKTTYVVNNDEIKMWAELLADAKDNGIKSIFTKENLLMVLSWLFTALLSSGILVYLLKSKKLKIQGAKEIGERVEEILKTETGKALLEYMDRTYGPTINKIASKLCGTEETCKVLARCFILAQEDTPEARLAIIEELTKLQTNEENLTSQVKAIIEKEIENNNEIIENQKKALQELKDANESISTTQTTKQLESEDIDYGQI